MLKNTHHKISEPQSCQSRASGQDWASHALFRRSNLAQSDPFIEYLLNKADAFCLTANPMICLHEFVLILLVLVCRCRETTQGQAIGEGSGQLNRPHQLPASLERTGQWQVHRHQVSRRNRCINGVHRFNLKVVMGAESSILSADQTASA